MDVVKPRKFVDSIVIVVIGGRKSLVRDIASDINKFMNDLIAAEAEKIHEVVQGRADG